MKFSKAYELATRIEKAKEALNDAIAEAHQEGFQVKVSVDHSNTTWPISVSPLIDPSKLEF